MNVGFPEKKIPENEWIANEGGGKLRIINVVIVNGVVARKWDERYQ
jgi:hypothetical protein